MEQEAWDAHEECRTTYQCDDCATRTPYED
jgi:hypothetical protein